MTDTDRYNGRPVLFFDGVCDLCNGLVQFIIRHDKKEQFLFASLQSEAGKQARSALQQRDADITPDSVILFYKGRYHSRSAAALQVFRLLGGAWSLLYIGIIIPPFLRNAVYNIVARNRYRWFGKRAECMLPTPDMAGRFLS